MKQNGYQTHQVPKIRLEILLPDHWEDWDWAGKQDAWHNLAPALLKYGFWNADMNLEFSGHTQGSNI